MEVTRGSDQPAVIVLDVRLARRDGAEKVQALRCDPRFASVPIVAVTAQSEISEADALRLAGFDAVVTKPCLPEEMIPLIEMYLSDTKR